jgi:hypothetical protein
VTAPEDVPALIAEAQKFLGRSRLTGAGAPLAFDLVSRLVAALVESDDRLVQVRALADELNSEADYYRSRPTTNAAYDNGASRAKRDAARRLRAILDPADTKENADG